MKKDSIGLANETINYNDIGYQMPIPNLQFHNQYPEEFITGMKMINLAALNTDIRTDEITVSTPHENIFTYLKKVFYTEEHIIQQLSHSSGYIYSKNKDDYITFFIDNISINFYITGSVFFVEAHKLAIKNNFKEVGPYIKWVYNNQGEYIKTPLDINMLPVDEMYPFLSEKTLEQYYQEYLDSTANILLLLGPPGGGKTTFIRGLLHYAKSSAIVSYDPDILSQDNLFVDFIRDERVSFLVLEDSDSFLSSRTDGNTMMHRFLNVSNGLVSSSNKKIIFSTNLPSIRDVDSALTRPGRCFDVAHFNQLDQKQALKLAGRVGKEIDMTKTQYSIADVYHNNALDEISQPFGFN